jgi:hypothetical protein
MSRNVYLVVDPKSDIKGMIEKRFKRYSLVKDLKDADCVVVDSTTYPQIFIDISGRIAADGRSSKIDVLALYADTGQPPSAGQLKRMHTWRYRTDVDPSPSIREGAHNFLISIGENPPGAKYLSAAVQKHDQGTVDMAAVFQRLRQRQSATG